MENSENPQSENRPPQPVSKHPVQTTNVSQKPSEALGMKERLREVRREESRWWLKLFLLPLLLLLVGAILIAGLGYAQQKGWISAGENTTEQTDSDEKEEVQYVCSMLCTPPLAEPGKCPVCGMTLDPIPINKISRHIQIDPASRRVANIQTAVVKAIPMVRTIRAVGELAYDEGSMKTIAAYVDGRIDKLYADYTGVVVQKGDRLALLYSPKLYSSQIEYLLAKKTFLRSQNSTRQRLASTSRELFESSRERLIELGMTANQIQQLEQAGKADSRMHLVSPIQGTVLEKLAVEGTFVKEGQTIYKVADLSSLWLMLELFPEEAAAIRYGQKIESEVDSLRGKKFTGRVAFINPMVDKKTRTVGVRVVIPNKNGLLRVGDFAKATIHVPLNASGHSPITIYDPDLANKWISPRHPYVVESKPGKCRVCGVELVPASQFGFTSKADKQEKSLVVPRDAILAVGNTNVLYVEKQPGFFQIRTVVIGTISGNRVVIQSGVKEGEIVATRGNFLIDSQMQLVGNPSLIDPTKADRAEQKRKKQSPKRTIHCHQKSPPNLPNFHQRFAS